MVFGQYRLKNRGIMNNMKEGKLNWINVAVVALGELILGLFIFQLYPMMSMLFFGEGGGSLLYSSGNSVSWALLPVLIPTIINVINIHLSLTPPILKSAFG